MSDDLRDDQLDGGERELASALRSLTPIASTIDPISAAFEAGRQSQARVTRLWRGTGIAVVLATVTLNLTSLLPHRARPERPQDLARVVAPAQQPPELSEQSVLRLREVVLDRGWAALPATPGGGGGVYRSATVRGML
jgi:hypothetical protein